MPETCRGRSSPFSLPEARMSRGMQMAVRRIEWNSAGCKGGGQLRVFLTVAPRPGSQALPILTMNIRSLLICSALVTSSFAADDEKDFKQLFNGKDLAGWHVRNPGATNHWKVVDGVLLNDLQQGEHGVDLITDQTL